MHVTRKQTAPYRAGKYKGLSSAQAICSGNGYCLVVSEIVGTKEFAVSFSSSHLCSVASINDGIKVCSRIFDKFKKPNYLKMVSFCEG